MATEFQLNNLFSAVTDALLADPNVDLDTIIAQYAVPRADVDSLIGIIRRLHLSLVGAQPSRRFVRRLKNDLAGDTQDSVMTRIRYLPARVQIAAGIALVAGFMLITRRRMVDEVKHDKKEVPAV